MSYEFKTMYTNGEVLEVIQDEKPSLRQMQSIVGGYIQVVYLRNGTDVLVVNEEGLLEDLAVNHVASVLGGQYIVGNTILMKRKYFED